MPGHHAMTHPPEDGAEQDFGSWSPLPNVLAEVRVQASQAVAQGDLERAVTEYQRVTSLAPRDLNASDAFARLLASSGRRREASLELLRLAVLCADMGHRGDAMRSLEHAGQLDPSTLVRENLAPLVFRLGPRSRPFCEHAIDEHLDEGRLVEARDLLAMLVEAQPDATDTRYHLARVELKLDHVPIAVRHLRIVVEQHRRARRYSRLIPVAEDLLTHGGPDTAVLWELSVIYLRRGLDERALEKLEAIHRLLPDDLEILERVATLRARLDRGHSAVSSLWRLVRGRRAEGADDRATAELLRRARAWSESTEYHQAVDALARKVLPLQAAPRISTPDWALSKGSGTANPTGGSRR